MEQPLIVRGRYAGRTFIPDGPLPDEEGTAELVITPTATAGARVGCRRLWPCHPCCGAGTKSWPRCEPIATSGATADLPRRERRDPIGRRGCRDPRPSGGPAGLIAECSRVAGHFRLTRIGVPVEAVAVRRPRHPGPVRRLLRRDRVGPGRGEPGSYRTGHRPPRDATTSRRPMPSTTPRPSKSGRQSS